MLKALCPLIFAQLLADTATSGQPSANPAPALCRLWWDSGTVRAAAERWAGRVEGIGLTKAWLGGKANLPFSTAWKTFAQLSWAPQHHRKRGYQGYSMLLSCPAAWLPCTQSIIPWIPCYYHNWVQTSSMHTSPTPLPTNSSQQASLSDVLRTGKLHVYLCLSIMLFVEGQINHKLKLIGMQNYLKNAN